MKIKLSVLLFTTMFNVDFLFANESISYNIENSDRYVLDSSSYSASLSVDYSFNNQLNFNKLTNGLEEKNVFSVAVKNNSEIIYAATNKGVVISTDGGNSFSLTSLKNHYVNSIVVDKNGVVYAGTNGKGLYISRDDGKTFVQNAFLKDKIISSLFINSKGIVYAGTWGGLAISEDSGVNFSKVTEGLANNLISSVFVTSNGTIYAGVIGRGLFISENGGNSFISCANGTYQNNVIKSIYVDQSNNIYIGIQTYSNRTRDRKSGDMLISRNNGQSFTSILPSHLKGTISSVYIDKNGMIYAGKENLGVGLLISEDGGLNFNFVESTKGFKIFNIFVSDSRNFFAGSENMILKY